jgi:hypothetical protein
MRKLHNVLLACAVGAGSLLSAAAPASAARVVVGTARPAVPGRVLPGYRYYGTGYRAYGYRYGYPYGFGSPYGYGVNIGVGYGGAYVGGGYGYAPYPALYGRPAYWARRPYWRPYRRAYWGPRFVR